MSTNRPTSSTTVIVVAVASMFCFTMAAAVAIVVAVPEGTNPGALVALLLAAMGTAVPAVLALAKIGRVAAQVDDLSNGLMDSKIRAGVADVLPPQLVHQDAREQLESDRARRSDSGGTSTARRGRRAP